jgi:2-iminoacetate synthase
MFSSSFSASLARVDELPNLATSLDCHADPSFQHDPRVAALFWNSDFGAGGQLDRQLLFHSRETKTALSGGDVYAVVPLYVTSICRERCLYCNYRAGAGRNVPRLRLDETQLEHEARFLVEQKGLRAIELVYASDPSISPSDVARHVERLRRLLDRNGGGVIGLSAEPFEAADYRSLVSAGLDFAVVWQETYDGERYRHLHPGSSPKTDFDHRLDTLDRMIEGGLLRFGMGVLSGLSDWRREWAMLMQHEAYLFERYGIAAAILGVPRLKPAPGAVLQTTPFVPSDSEYLLAIALHNLFSPATLPFVNTRETWELCVEMAAGGGCLFTFNCSTIPGGYSLGQQGSQFPTASFDAPDFARRLEQFGLRTQFDWSFPEVSSPAA